MIFIVIYMSMYVVGYGLFCIRLEWLIVCHTVVAVEFPCVNLYLKEIKTREVKINAI